ncbi:MAG TPA: tetratricopeptide repeat protein [Chloroflexota bacterium]
MPEPEQQIRPLMVALIADVRGYTGFTAEKGDEAAAILARTFARLAREVIDARNGMVVELRGDEALCVFSSARYALQAAVALQDRCTQESISDPSLPLRVGIGLDAGELIPVEGGYRGGALNLAARLCSLAGPGETFASQTVINVARKTAGISVVDRGEVQLKGLPDPVRVVQVAAEGALPSELPPLQPVLVAHTTNLPDEPTPFIGREREIETLSALIKQPHVRLISLTGSGGSGKTRLALQVASRSLHDFPHGVFFVSLGGTSDATLVGSAIANALGIQEVAGRSLEETLESWLRDKRCLLLLDNFEHLLDACPLIAALLDRCPIVTLLVTSRSILHLSREHVFEVQPLTVPDSWSTADIGSIIQYESVALFIERATAAKKDFTVTRETAPLVAEICYRLDGLPLAIELAAARIRLFPPQALLERLSNRLKLLTGGARDLPTRHQTLRGTVDWSYSLLTEPEQTLFSRLSVFAGGCTLDAAEEVCDAGGSLEVDLLDVIASLVDKSLLRQEGQESPRLAMLDTLREYAAERLEAGGEVDEIRHRFASYFMTLAEDAEDAMLRGVQLPAWLDRLDREHDNLREALGWLVRTGQTEEALRLAGALFPFWNARGHWREGRRWLEEALSVNADVPDAVRAKALLAIGSIVGARYRDYAYARAQHEEALTLWRRVGDRDRVNMTLSSLANTTFQQGDDHWRIYYEEALANVRDVPATYWRAMILGNLGLVAYHDGNWGQATRHFEESLAISRQIGEEFNAARSTGWLARLAFDREDFRRATDLAQEGVRQAYRGHYMLPLMFCLDILAGIAVVHGQADLAGRIYGAVEALQHSTGGLLLPQIIAKRQPLVDAACTQIGQAAWNESWQKGLLMPLDQVVILATGDPDLISTAQ